MKYYLISGTINLKEIGRYPQCDSPKSIGNLRELDYSKPIDNLVLPEPVINSKAIDTTYLKGSYINSRRFLIIKDYFLEFLKDYCLEDYQYWNIKVHYKTEVLNDYYLFYIPKPDYDKSVDYSKSKFSIKKIKDWQDKGEKINVSDFSNYIDILDVLPEGTTMVCDKLVISFKDEKKDFFKTARIPFINGYLVSERLKNTIEKEGFTGMTFREISELDKRIEVIY